MNHFSANTFLIGAQRTGTTNLAALLSLHPQITVSEPKEPLFFTRNWNRGLDWYASRFSSRETPIALDASTWYSAAPTAMFPTVRGSSDECLIGVPARIHSIAPESKIIYIVRNPPVRTNSLFWMMRREHQAFARFRSLRQAMESDPFILRGSDYMGQLQHYLEYFDRSRILVVVFEEMVRDIPATLRRCHEFLGVDPAVAAIDSPTPRRNESFMYTASGDTLRRLLGSRERLERLRRRAPSWFGRMLTAPIPPLHDRDRAYIEELFQHRNGRLEQFLDRPLDEWRTTQNRN